jgi:SEC-C motif-containing protein
MAVGNPCPCNSGRSYSACCKPAISGNKCAVTAEALMRSRYTAYVVKDVNYLLRTWHSSERPATIVSAKIPDWYGLHIVRTEAGNESDTHGVVEFKAKAAFKKKLWNFHEVSRFVKENNQWFYIDGDVIKSPPAISSKVGRNAPCPCGSGKKYKKCCGQ